MGRARTATDAVALDLDGRKSAVASVDLAWVGVPDVDVKMPSTLVLDTHGLDKYGIAAIAPPQLAVPREGVVVLDLEHATYDKRARGDAEKLARGKPTFETTNEPCGTMRTKARIDGIDAALLIDTGSPISGVYTASRAGAPLVARVPAWEASEDPTFGAGAREQYVAPNINVAIGDLAGTMWFAIWHSDGHVHDEMCAFDGVIGVDFLIDRHCVLPFDLAGNAPGDAGLRFVRVRGFCRP